MIIPTLDQCETQERCVARRSQLAVSHQGSGEHRQRAAGAVRALAAARAVQAVPGPFNGRREYSSCK